MRTTALMTCAMLSLIAAPAANAQGADPAKNDDADRAAAGGGALPAGWSARPDGDGDVKAIKFVTMKPGYHLTLGPATILYRKGDRATGPFHTLATFHQMKKLKHAEGYGLIMGGQELAGKDQRYTYFLVRGEGTYLIKKRNGEQTSEVSKGWTAHPAIKKVDAEGKAVNLLEIDAKLDSSKIDFKVNGQTVHTASPKDIDTRGIVGLRANHNLDLHIEGFDLHQ